MVDPLLIYLFLIFLCIGSFLNVVAWRIIKEQNLYGRSSCIHCQAQLAWYDLIPVLSWILLRGACRNCKVSISLLYPFIELLTACLLTALYLYIPATYQFGYGIFICALIVTIRTDLETMLIPRIATLYLLPIAWALSYLGYLPLTFQMSIISSLLGYAILRGFAELFYLIRGVRGMGEGDFELLACIGAFTGPFGMWSSIMIGSLSGTLYGIYQMIRERHSIVIIPFGPFLALGALVFLFSSQWQNFIKALFSF